MSELILKDVHKRFGDHVVLAGLELTVPAGSFTALLGPSGVGKTTLLRLLAGFDRPDHGTIAIGGHVLSGDRVHVPPDQRRIGYVPQEGSLFPHLTVAANIGFGLARAQRRARVAELLELVELTGLDHRYPHQLSGGQQQRVALARALAVRPEVVLLDEPFASLDAQLRAGVRDDVRRILAQAGTTTLLVTHNQDEALSSADLVAVLRDGRIVQSATPDELYEQPTDGQLASFVGDANLVSGTLSDGVVETSLGQLPIRTGTVGGEGQRAGEHVTALVRPEQIVVAPGGNGSGPCGRIIHCDYHGHDTVISVQLEAEQDETRVLARALGNVRLTPGQRVGLSVRGTVLIWPSTPHVTSEHFAGSSSVPSHSA
jgi:iron(III) transport system ATP-binding protein